MTPSLRLLLVAGAIALGLALLLVPPALARWWLTEDAIEHLLIAHQWLHGSGFVNPVQWHFYLDANVPLPGAATRAPVISWLLAVPLALGQTLREVIIWHTLWSCVVIGALVCVAHRFMRLPAAAACGLWLGTSPGWQYLSRFPWTEVTALAAFLAVLVSAPGVARTPLRALLAALITGLAWLVRPNLGAMALAVVVASFWELAAKLGPRAALRHSGPWSYVAGFAAFVAVARVLTEQLTGLPIYAGYGVAAEMFDVRELSYYGKEFMGSAAFVSANFARVVGQVQLRVEQLVELLFFDSGFNFVGWLALPGLWFAFHPGRDRALELRVAALALLGFAALVCVYYGGFDRSRHALFPIAAACLCGLAALDAASVRLEARLEPRRARQLQALPLLALALLFAFGAPRMGAQLALASWAGYQRNGPIELVGYGFEEHAAEFCKRIDASARVASFQPWLVAFWCGNPGTMLPLDLDDPALLERFLSEREPRYLLADERSEYAWISRSARLRKLHQLARFSLWEVRGAQAPADWEAAPPLACAGKPRDCLRHVGRLPAAE